MERWAPDMLERNVAEDNFHVSPFREDGVTYGTPVWIWGSRVLSPAAILTGLEG